MEAKKSSEQHFKDSKNMNKVQKIEKKESQNQN
jgi:hypothetical protein